MIITTTCYNGLLTGAFSSPFCALFSFDSEGSWDSESVIIFVTSHTPAFRGKRLQDRPGTGLTLTGAGWDPSEVFLQDI